MKKVLTIGGAMSDMLLEYPDAIVHKLMLQNDLKNYLLLEEGKKLEIERVSFSEGGGAVNAAVSFARQGLDTAIICKIGNDENGKRIIKKLINESVDTSRIVHAKEGITGMSFIIPFASGDRAVLVYAGVNKKLKFDEIDSTILHGVDQIYISALRGSAMLVLPEVAQYAHAHGVPVAINPGSGQLRTGAALLIEALPFVNTLILNAFEAGLLLDALRERDARYTHKKIAVSAKPFPQLLSSDSPINLAEFGARLMHLGLETIVITNGAQGVYVMQEKELLFHPGMPVKVVSTLGAGDAFGSAFVGSVLAGCTPEQALVRGLANSASVLAHKDTQTGLLSNDQLAKKSLEIGVFGIQKFVIS